MTETLEHKLALLKLGRMREVYQNWIEQAAQTQMGYGEFLEHLVTEELGAANGESVTAQDEGSRISLCSHH